MFKSSAGWIAFTLAGTLIWLPCGVGFAGESDNRSALIAACKIEAERGHLAGFLQERREHAKRMAAICDEWQTVGREGQNNLLRRCLAESRRGPSIGHRQRPQDQSHMFRLGELCRKLANI